MPLRLSKPREHVGLTVKFMLWASWLTAEIGLLLDLFHTARLLELVGVGLGSFGAIFAILAMIDAHKAFVKAEQVEEAIGSFRMSFQDVIDEMVKMCRNAQHTLSILIPTPGYGYLFDETDLSRSLVEELEAFIRRDGTKLDLFLIVGDQSRPAKELIPQRYLRRAFQLEEERKSRAVTARGYIELIERVFSAVDTNASKAKLTILKADPNIRLIIADDQQDNRCCLLSFAQSDPANIAREFKSTGFKSTHGHMVQAVNDLLAVYSSELGSEVEHAQIDYIKSFYVMAR